MIFYEWEVYPKVSEIMCANIIKVCTTDGEYMKTYLHGAIFDFWALMPMVK